MSGAEAALDGGAADISRALESQAAADFPADSVPNGLPAEDSGSEFDAAGLEDAEKDYDDAELSGSSGRSLAGGGGSSDSDYSGRKRKRVPGRGHKAVKRAKRPENDMTKKLRSAVPPEPAPEPTKHTQNRVHSRVRELQAGTASRAGSHDLGDTTRSEGAGPREPGRASKAGSRDTSAEFASHEELTRQSVDGPEEDGEELGTQDEEPAAVVRNLSPEQEAADRAAFPTMWEWASVLEFMDVFRGFLALPRQISADELEGALVLSPGGEGTLADVHKTVLRGISTRAEITDENWVVHLGDKLRYHWASSHFPGRPPFAPVRGYAAAEYAALPTKDRVLALKALCEMRLDRGDLQNFIEDCIKPPKLTKAERAKGAVQRVACLEAVRREPLGVDGSGLVYWYLDMWQTSGVRLYRETPPELVPKPKPGSGRGSRRKAPGPGPWELLGASLEELQAVGEKLARSQKKPDKRLASKVLDEIVPELAERRAEEERRLRAAARMRQQAGALILDDGFGRSRRTRKQVNYAYDDYDDAIRAAIRGERDRGRPQGSGRNQPQDSRPSALEEAHAGLRRGRSAATAEPFSDKPLPDSRSGRQRYHENRPSNQQTPDSTSEGDDQDELDSPLAPHAQTARLRHDPAAADEQHAQQGQQGEHEERDTNRDVSPLGGDSSEAYAMHAEADDADDDDVEISEADMPAGGSDWQDAEQAQQAQQPQRADDYDSQDDLPPHFTARKARTQTTHSRMLAGQVGGAGKHLSNGNAGGQAHGWVHHVDNQHYNAQPHGGYGGPHAHHR